MITIRKAEISDAQSILNHAKIVFAESSFLLTEPEEYSMTLEKEEEWLNKNSQLKHLVLVAETEEGKIIGMLNFAANERAKVAHIGYFGISIQAAYCNQRIGAKMITDMLEWAEKEPGVEKVCLEVFANNERAIHLYKKLGFAEEGRKIRHIKLRDGSYQDEILMYQFVK